MKNVRHVTFALAIAALGGLLLNGCSKKEEEVPPPTPPAVKVERPKPTTPDQPKTTSSAPENNQLTASTFKPPVPQLSPAAQAQAIAGFESAYLATPEFAARVGTIYKISDAGGAEAVAALGRLFTMERDNDLKIEIVSSLFDIDGEDDRKVALLTAAVAANQPKEVREEAIDALLDLEPRKALPILQSLLGDADEDIREAAKDAVEQVQTEMAMGQ